MSSNIRRSHGCGHDVLDVARNCMRGKLQLINRAKTTQSGYIFGGFRVEIEERSDQNWVKETGF